jgi:hypothetical protein
MARPSLRRRVAARVPGIPRTPREVLTSLQLLAELRRLGWHKNISGGMPSCAAEPLPWFSYPAIRWLSAALRSSDRVFEYGAGASTLWFDRRVREIMSVEHDSQWFARLRQPEHGTILCEPCSGTWWEGYDPDQDSYLRAIIAGAPWDVVVVDGMARNAAVQYALDHLNPEGIIVVDDTHNSQSASGQRTLARAGFGRVDFEGVKPGLGIVQTTTVFSMAWQRWAVRCTETLTVGRTNNGSEDDEVPRL